MKRFKALSVFITAGMLMTCLLTACSTNTDTVSDTSGGVETLSSEEAAETTGSEDPAEPSETTETTGTTEESSEATTSTMPPAPSESSSETSAAGEPRKVTISDAYKKKHKTEFLGKVTSRYPKVAIEGVDTSALNKEIAKKFRSIAKDGEVDYWYRIGEEAVTIFISYTCDADYYDGGNDVYNISRSTGKKMTRKQMLKVCGISSSKFNSRVKAAIKKQWKEAFRSGADYVKKQFKKATSKKSLNRAMPYLNKKGKLCFLIKGMDSLGGSGYEDACGPC